jgi:hypothetical protein
MPSTHSGVEEEDLVKVFNLFDIYVQPSICEGWGLPIMESKACAVPGLYQNYSAMEDHVQNGGGMAIKVQRFYHEAETSAIRSLPSIPDMIKGMEKLAFNDKLRNRMSLEARKCAEDMHSWDLTAKKLEDIFDGLEVGDRTASWDKPPKIEFLTSERPPANLSNNDFILWLYINILKRPPDEKGYHDWMGTLQKGGNRHEVEAFFREQINSTNKFEQVRWKHSLINRGMPPEIDPTNIKADIMPGMAV